MSLLSYGSHCDHGRRGQSAKLCLSNYGRACLNIGVSGLSLTMDTTLISLELEPCKYNCEVSSRIGEVETLVVKVTRVIC
jgi:hypothetical protein